MVFIPGYEEGLLDMTCILEDLPCPRVGRIGVVLPSWLPPVAASVPSDMIDIDLPCLVRWVIAHLQRVRTHVVIVLGDDLSAVASLESERQRRSCAILTVLWRNGQGAACAVALRPAQSRYAYALVTGRVPQGLLRS
jgi:hypothetical protein